MKKYIALILSLISCISCTSALNIRVAELTLLEQEQVFSDYESKITVVGMLHAVIESDIELIKFAKQHDYHLSYTIKGCSSKIKLSKWSIFYPKVLQTNGSTYQYDVVFDYKSLSNEIPEASYNLAKQPENLCLIVTAASMNPFLHAESNVVEVTITVSLIKKLQTYEANSGLIRFKKTLNP